MNDINVFDRFNPGDFVEHTKAPGVVWEIMVVDRYVSGGPHATLRHVGGDPLTYEQSSRIFDVWSLASRVCRTRYLVEANAMLTLAAISQHR